MVWPCDVAVNAAGGCGGNQLDRIFSKLFLNPITLVLNCNQNVKQLNDNLSKLDGKRRSVQHEVDEARRRAEKIEQEVTNWMTKADQYLTEDAKNLRDDLEERAKNRCLMGLCLNPVARYKLSKKAEEDAGAVDRLAQEPSGFRRISYFPIDRSASNDGDSGVDHDAFQEFDSRSNVLKETLDSLKDPGIKRIRLHGLPGVGKTTLAKEVKTRAQNEKLFDAVVFAAVTETPDFKRIRDEIARVLDLSEEISEGQVAGRIEAKLKEKKNVLVILDDVWAKLDLKKIGVPLEKTELKILLTSRNRDVLPREMRSDNNIEVGQLQGEEARKLFVKIVGADVESSNLKEIAIQIVEKCGGLPLAITTLGNALKGREYYEWEDALERLGNPSGGNFKGISAELYSAIEFSYDHLIKEDVGLQKTFLLCSFLSNLYNNIELLVRYAVGLNLFPNINTIKATRHRVLTFVSKLKDAALLIDVNSNRSFGIHDVVRDVAMAIAVRDNCGLLLEDGKQLDREALTKFHWIFFVDQPADIIADLPNDMEYPQLALFHLGGFWARWRKDQIIEIPASLFKGMQKLKVLNVSTRWMVDACLSLSFLTNLRSLTLQGEGLDNMTALGELRNLEVLWIDDRNMEELPSEVGKLTRLKLLDLRRCLNLKVISPNVIANLSKLEELYFDTDGGSLLQWCIESEVLEENGERRNATITELAQLHSLRVLHINLYGTGTLRTDFIDLFSRLESFEIANCSGFHHLDYKDWSRTMWLEMDEGILLDLSSIGRLLKRTEALYLSGMKGVKNVVHELDAEGFQELKLLMVERSSETQYIVNSVDVVGSDAFPILEKLGLSSMHNLKGINHGRLGATSFSKLKEVHLDDCPQMKILFSLSIVRQLSQLQEIVVDDCMKMVGIVDEEGQGDTNNEIVEATDQTVELGQLRSLSLSDMPEFISFCYGKKSSLIDENQQNQLINDPSSRPIPLFNKKVVFPNLEELELKRIEKITMICHMARWCCIPNLAKLSIEFCDNLVQLFSSSTATGLVNLRHLKIANCKNIRGIMVTENAETMEGLVSFSQLNLLDIKNLPKLVGFYLGNYKVEFSSLKQLNIENCPKFKTFAAKSWSTVVVANMLPLFNEQVTFPNLGKLVVRKTNKITMICHMARWCCIPNLAKLSIEFCDNLVQLFSSSTATGLVNLRHLKIANCKNIRGIMVTENAETMEGLVSFSQLNLLEIENLPELVGFYLGDYTVEFSSLKKLKIEDCPKLKTLAAKSWSTVVEANMLPLFNEQVTFPNLGELVVRKTNKITMICHMARWCCIPNLAKLTIDGCHNLVRLFSSSTATGLVNLRELRICNCKNIREILVLENVEDMEGLVSFSQLNVLEIKGLPNLVGFYLGNYTVEFSSLKQLEIENCPKFKTFAANSWSTVVVANMLPLFNEQVKFPVLERLNLFLVGIKFLFTSSTVENFQQLKELRVCDCKMMKGVIVAEEESKCEVLTVLFPKLEELLLSWLTKPTPTSFYREFTSNCSSSSEQISESQASPATPSTLVEITASELVFPHSDSQAHVKELPSLRIIRVVGCYKVWIFSLDFPLLEKMQKDNQLESWIEHRMSWANQLASNIEEVALGCASSSEILQCEGHPCKEKVADASTQFSDLSVSRLRVLQVVKFDKIKNLVGSSVSFENLQALEVDSYSGLINLMRYSMAKRLVRLRKMSISNCYMLEEIIVCLECLDDVKDGIVFSQLEYLHLSNLPRLSSFCSVECNFKFPSLKEMSLEHCPNMQTFSKGELSTPVECNFEFPSLEEHVRHHPKMLPKRQMMRRSGKNSYIPWDGNINTAIQELFVEKNPFEVDENMMLESIFGVNEEV